MSNDRDALDDMTETMELITSAADLLRAYAAGRRDFRAAYLRRADLRDAYLSDADLRGADLSDADLSGADLRDADLRDADLRDADLRDADLRDADLRDAYLSWANLSEADLRDANLSGADLRDADLRRAYLRGAYLRDIRADVERVLAQAPAEVAGLLAALRAGGVDGSFYDSHECVCLVGTLARLGERSIDELHPDSSSAAERWAMAIQAGDTPETSQIVALTAEWVAAWLEARQEASDGQRG